MSTSEAEASDSYIESPSSYNSESPYSSPSQQVPQLTANISQLSWVGNSFGKNGKQPELVIVEQPQNHFRFRYKSEMIGTHGCILGKSSSNSKTKTHPTVELKNYAGKALLRCTLARHDSSDEHPHKLLEDDQDRDVSGVVPHHELYRIAFSGMGIIHTAKKDVPELLLKKYTQGNGAAINENKLRIKAETDAKNMNLNIVRLKFSAHNLTTDEEICPPVFSEPIHNMKSASTNDLRICRISRCTGKPKGGDDVYIFVEKVNRKNIQINFFELDNGERVWSSTGNFLQNDVHHQYAIAFRTPPYRDVDIVQDVKVYIELVRPSDGRTSEPREFTYKHGYGPSKKRKANSAFSSLDSIESSISYKQQFNEIPAPIQYAEQNGDYKIDTDDNMKDITKYTLSIPQTTQVAPTSVSIMADAMWDNMGVNSIPSHYTFSPLLSQPNVPEAPVPILQLNSSELDRIVTRDIPSEEKKLLLATDLSDYFKQFGASDDDMPGAMANFLKSSMLVPDSAKPENVNIKTEPNVRNTKKINSEYSASYTHEDGTEVKKLVKELCDMIRNKSSDKKELIRSKLDRLFEIRLGNGDTFLHMTLASNQPSLQYIVKLIHSMKMPRLLNLKNNKFQTILHLAIVNDMPRLVNLLVSKGCNPMEEDGEGNNAVHYAVLYQSCLPPLLEAIRVHAVPCDIDAFNNEKQTALHISAVYDSAESATALLRHGAKKDVRDTALRTPLHLAAYDGCSTVVRVLVENSTLDEIDAVDGKGYTALQIACDSEIRKNTLEIIQILLEHKADPNKHEEFNQPAFILARHKPDVLKILKPYTIDQLLTDDDIKSEPEDEFDSAEEGDDEPTSLPELSLYEQEVSELLEKTGAWRDLAQSLQRGSLLSWFNAADHPATRLLRHIKDCDDMTSKSLEVLLKSLGQIEAAAAIRKHLTD